MVDELRALLHLGIPLIVAQLLQVSYGFVAIVMMGRVGTLELAAIGLGTSLWVMVFLATLGVLMVVSPVVARQFGIPAVACPGIMQTLRPSATVVVNGDTGQVVWE